MKIFFLLTIVVLLSACGLSKVTTKNINGYTFKSFKNPDHSIVTYVKVSDSMFAVFRSQPPTGDPGPSEDVMKCLLCYISKIGECKNSVCNPEDVGDICKDKIRDCATEKCRAEGQCPSTSPHAWRFVAIQ